MALIAVPAIAMVKCAKGVMPCAAKCSMLLKERSALYIIVVGSRTVFIHAESVESCLVI
ncbi:MAG: hypothetical protein K6E77_11245 [Lachnospiraceae bacterium]|nr:hypothetical protein [Lachnospiraceae bacterium]